MTGTPKATRSSLFVIFTTVLVDLIGFGMIIPLIALYGRHYGASATELGILGASYSLMQFFFAPLWGAVSDRFGRRPILLLSLAGSTASYLAFSQADTVYGLIFARSLAGLFAANISTAQAFIADTTTPENRARGMGLIGAAFGIGFTLGPPLGGIASHYGDLSTPGLIAALICGINFLVAIFRLPESLPLSSRNTRSLSLSDLSPIAPHAIKATRSGSALGTYLLIFFFFTLAFAMMEQTFSLLFQSRFAYATEEAALKTGLILMWAGVIGAFIQGGLTKRLVPRFGEYRLLMAGLGFAVVGMVIFPFSPSYAAYFAFVLPIAVGSSLINPSLTSLISKEAAADRQGQTLGINQGLGSLARALGPFAGLQLFVYQPWMPYGVAAIVILPLLLMLASRAPTRSAEARAAKR